MKASLFGTGLIAVYLMAGSVGAAQIPRGCSAQAPWGAPAWKGKEPPLTPLCRTAYVALHDDSKLVPNFVSWHLTTERVLGCLPRKDSFIPDPDLQRGRRAELADYKGKKGFDRGHFAPNADFAWDADVQRESFYLSNMSPQASRLNQWQWERLEEATRAWANSRGAIVVMDGPIWKGPSRTIGANGVAIPAAYWKVVVDRDTHEALAFIMKNEPTPKGDLSPYQVTIADVEKEAGISLPLPKGVSRTKQGTLWPFDLAAFKKAKAKKCPKK